MNKLCLFPALLFLSLSVIAQDTTWNIVKIDETLILSLPGKIIKTDTFITEKTKRLEVLIYKAGTAAAPVGVSVTPHKTSINADKPGSHMNANDELAEGFRIKMEENGMHVSIQDILIDGIPGKKAKSFKDDPENGSALYTYMFVINHKLYSINAYVPKNTKEKSEQIMARLLTTIHFTASQLSK